MRWESVPRGLPASVPGHTSLVGWPLLGCPSLLLGHKHFVSTQTGGGWKVQAEGTSRATSVHKTKGEAVANAKEPARNRRGAGRRASCSSTSKTATCRRNSPTGSVNSLSSHVGNETKGPGLPPG